MQIPSLLHIYIYVYMCDVCVYVGVFNVYNIQIYETKLFCFY